RALPGRCALVQQDPGQALQRERDRARHHGAAGGELKMSVYPQVEHTDPSTLKLKDFQSDQDVRWCPGCGDYSILANVQRALPALGVPRENYVFVSGIGCSSRF